MVDPKLWAEAKRVFNDATELPREERKSFAKETCGDDIALLELVEGLLRGDYSSDGDGVGLGALIEARDAQADPPGVGVLPPSREKLRDSAPDWARDAGTPFQSDTLLTDRYRVLRRLGGGGMGVVYAAQDIRLQRQVALKFLPREWSRDDDAMERFVREARAASALDHPNICTVHEISELESHELFIVMAFYEGETLDRKIRRGDLSVDEAVDVTIRVARALDRAHEAGIFHRDIKPANIMITRHNEVKVLDFGLAKLLGESRLSRDGQVMGTVPYMSPEQLRGDSVDHRTDLWSLGVSLYEMLTGRRPFEGNQNGELTRSILKDELRIANDVPRPLRTVLRRALQRNPRHRYQSAGHLLEDLEPLQGSTSGGHRSTTGRRYSAGRSTRRGWLAAGLGAALITLLAVFQFMPASDSEPIESVVVLPFKKLALAGDPADDYLVDGLTEALIAELGRIGAWRVISRTTAQSFKDSLLSLTEIARQLDVDAVVEGSAARRSEGIRVTVKLIRGDPEEVLWTSIYDRDLGDALNLMGDVARQIAAAGGVDLTPDEAVLLATKRQVDPRALELYLRGRHLWHVGNLESSLAARDLFHQALQVDPGYALAHSGLADAYPGAYHSGEMTAEEAFGKARLHARRAIELDDTLAEAYTSLMRVALESDWDWDASELYIHRALELNPNYAVAHHWLAWHFATVGRFDEAVEQIDRAQLLDPVSSKISGDRVRFVYLAGRYEDTIEAATKLLKSEPDLRVPRRFLARALMELGRPEEAVIELERVAKSDSSIGVLGELGHIYALSGRVEEASRLLNQFLEEDPPPAYPIALIHLGLGSKDAALDWLDRAYKQRSIRLVGIKGDPRLDPLRSDPRFNDLLERMKLDDRSLNGQAAP